MKRADVLYLELEGSRAAPLALPPSGAFVIGSSRERAQLVLAGLDAAHCAIGRLKEGGFAIKDLGSATGIAVNGQRIASARLKVGDRIVLGPHALRVVAASASERATDSGADTGDDSGADSGNDSGAGAAADASAANSGARAATDSSARAPTIPGHRMLRRLGKGAMGEVWLAVQERLQREVALKFLAPALAHDPEYVRRFGAEARAAAALNHPNVVVVFDVGGGTDGAPSDVQYLSMEYMEGGNVEELAQRRGALPWREVLPIFRDAARALDYARERQLVHRDVKPANLMFGPRGVVKLADLGLATSSHPEALATGAADGKKVFGTPHFIAPEQARGEAPDHRSDLYSLGATVWRLLAGRTPFQGTSTRDILRAAFTETPPPLRTLAPDCPAGLAALVERMLAKDPRQRPQSAAAVLQELDALVSATVSAVGGAAATPKAPATALRFALYGALLAAAGTAMWFALRDVSAPGALPHSNSGDSNASARRPTGSQAAPSGAFEAPSLDEPAHGGAPLAHAAPSAEELRVRELEAQLALRDAPPATEAQARLEALRALTAKHAGTAAAALAASECAELERAIEQATRARSEQAGAHAQALARLAERSSVDPQTGPFDALVRALHELRGPAMEVDIAADASLVGPRDERERALWDALSARAARQLADAEAARARGELAPLPGWLDELAQLPELPSADEARVAQRGALESARTRARELLAGLGDDQARRTSELARAERLRLSEALRGVSNAGKSCAQQIGSLDFSAARQRLAPLANSADPATRAAVELLDGELANSELAFQSFLASHAAAQWKRKTLVDPRPGRGGVHDVLGVDRDGARITREGAEERIPWSAFGTRLEALGPLFAGRLTRDWSDSERDGIAALQRVCAAALAATRLQAALAEATTRPFGPADAAALLALYDDVREAQSSPQALARWTAERVAAARIGRALVALGERRPAEAAAELESALDAAATRWTTALLSSGVPVEPPTAPALAPVAPALDPGSAVGAGAAPPSPPPSPQPPPQSPPQQPQQPPQQPPQKPAQQPPQKP
jgi:hypothetical protein